MKDLKCGLTDCRHNKGYSCVSREICVDHDTDCKTFSKNPKPRDVMFEAAGEFTKPNYSVDTRVSCSADCVFNKSDICVANGITVMSDRDSGASCLTFMKK